MQMARKAERTFQFESSSRSGAQVSSYLSPSGYWDTSRDGLLAAQNLYLGLKRLGMAYLERRPHDFELSKNISLRQIDPTALVSLRHNSSTNFSLHEVYFDLDFPGHYFRRIKTISASVYCVIGRYTSINCTLSLVENRTRISPAPGQYNFKGRDDLRFRTDRVPITSIAMTTGQNDAGVFELNMAGERYLPFEGAGVISTWKIEFPSEFSSFDKSTISDIVLHIKYTALDGGQALRDMANPAAKDFLKNVKDANSSEEDGGSGCFALLDLKNDFSNSWRQMQIAGTGLLTISDITDRLPFWTTGKDVFLLGIVLMIKKAVDTSDAKAAPLDSTASAGSSTNASITMQKLQATAVDPIKFEQSMGIDMGKSVTVMITKPLGAEMLLNGEWNLQFEKDINYKDEISAVVKYRTAL